MTFDIHSQNVRFDVTVEWKAGKYWRPTERGNIAVVKYKSPKRLFGLEQCVGPRPFLIYRSIGSSSFKPSATARNVIKIKNHVNVSVTFSRRSRQSDTDSMKYWWPNNSSDFVKFWIIRLNRKKKTKMVNQSNMSSIESIYIYMRYAKQIFHLAKTLIFLSVFNIKCIYYKQIPKMLKKLLKIDFNFSICHYNVT